MLKITPYTENSYAFKEYYLDEIDDRTHAYKINYKYAVLEVTAKIRNTDFYQQVIYAITSGYLPLVRKLIPKECHINAHAAIILSIQSKQIDIFKYLIQVDSKKIREPDVWSIIGATGNIEALVYLAHLDEETYTIFKPIVLQEATINNRQHIVEYLSSH